jgi:hypothetical protein
MIADILFAICVTFVAVAAAVMFYGAGLVSGYDKGRQHERKVLNLFHRRAVHARPGLN